MPAADLSAGFFGKIPATGDFVTRGLSPEFVRGWDQWVSRHLAPLQSSGQWRERKALCFLLGAEFLGPAAGVVLPSNDLAGRHFPLTALAQVPAASSDLAASASDWFEDIKLALGSALDARSTAATLEAELGRLQFPRLPPAKADVPSMLLWVRPDDLLLVDPTAPEFALQELLAASGEAG